MTRLPLLAAALVLAPAARAADWDRDPVRYSQSTPDNPVSRAQQAIAAGQTALAFEDDRGYLPSLLKALDIPASSQVLVFSKTSLQRERITPKTPRAVYFNDDVYVGFCLRGDVLEVSAADPALGAVFYTLDQEPAARPRLRRQTDTCLTCHGSSFTRGAPGHMVRSVRADRDGFPVLSAGSYRTDHTSPFEKRWGGWYVTGTHGTQQHMGNGVVQDRREADAFDNRDGQNVVDLSARFTTGNYLTPHSDVVALMVLEHQAEMHNRIARATLETRDALHYQAGLNKALGEPPTNRTESFHGRVKSAADAVVEYLLFAEEAPLAGPVKGTTTFAADFAARGPRDKKGRSLRDFDLSTRMFRHPCSYLIYSEAFDGMPAEVRDVVLRKLHDVLTGKTTDKLYAHLSAADRAAVLDILRGTKPNLPPYWKP